MAWLNRLGEEHDNMRVALSWSMQHDEVELALRLGGALRWFWNMSGYYSEGRSWLEAALGKEGPASAEARIKAVEGVGRLTVNQGDLDRAGAAAEEGLELSVEAGIRSEGAAHFKDLLREVARRQGDYLPFVLGELLYPGQGCRQAVFPYDLRSQVFGHVGDGGIGLIRLLRTDHYWGAAIFVVDPSAALASV